MDKSRVYSLNGDPAKIIEEKDDFATALVLMQTLTTCNITLVRSPISTFEPWHCQYANETDPKRIYCENGICMYPVPDDGSVSTFASVCMKCLNDSFNAELKE